jgi:chromosome partitioning protein
MIILLNSLYKGGVGKTTNNVLLTHLLALRGYRVLFMDFDPQMSGTRFLTGKNIDDPVFEEKNIFEAIKKEDLLSTIQSLTNKIDFVAGSQNINLYETLLDDRGYLQNQHLYLKWLLQSIFESGLYDFVVMDMSPSKSLLNVAVMAAATHHIVNVQSEVLAMEMIKSYLNDIELLQEDGINSNILGISIGMKDRTRLNKRVSEEIQKYFPEEVFKTITKRKSRIQEFVVEGFPVKNKRKMFNVKDNEALALHNQLTDEILKRLNMSFRKEEQ